MNIEEVNSKEVNIEGQNVPIQTDNYWTNNTRSRVKPTFTYDDILSSLNLSVSQNGVLQHMTIKPDINTDNINIKTDIGKNIHNVTSVKSGKIEPEVKHSYIYNKYFKNYGGEGQNEIIVPRVPKTIEEYRQMLLEDEINRQKAKYRASIIKSTKMLYTSNNNQNPSNNNNNYGNVRPTNVNRNKLNKMFIY